jgi:hypothetical protein
MDGRAVAGIFYSRYGRMSDMEIEPRAANYIAEVINVNEIPRSEANYIARRILDAAVRFSDKRLVTEHDVEVALTREFGALI